MHEPCRVTSTQWLCGRNFKCLPIYSWPQWGGELCKTRIFEWNVNPALHVFWYIFFIVISRAEDQWYIISQFRTIPHPIRHQMRCGIANFDPSYNITIYLWRIVAKAHTCHSHTHTHTFHFIDNDAAFIFYYFIIIRVCTSVPMDGVWGSVIYGRAE